MPRQTLTITAPPSKRGKPPSEKPAPVFPYALTASNILDADLSISPPDGFPKLDARQALFVKHRAANPLAGWRESYLAAGYAETTALTGAPTVESLRIYLSALAAGRMPATLEDPRSQLDHRRNILRTLARDAQDDSIPARERAVAAKVWLDACPAEERQALALSDLSLEELQARLTRALQAAGDHSAACLPYVNLVIPDGYAPTQFPSEGNSANPEPPSAWSGDGNRAAEDDGGILEAEAIPDGPDDDDPSDMPGTVRS